jgi:hypothetical protein
MSQSQSHNSGTNGGEQSRTIISRRSLLGALTAAVGGTAIGLTSGDTPAVEEISLGGNSRESLAAGHRHGRVSTAPSTLPPSGLEAGLMWFRPDLDPDASSPPSDDSFGSLGHAPAPSQWVGSGLGWSVASDYATAKANLPQRPGIAASTSGEIRFVADGSPPYQWTSQGMEFVVASSQSAARSRWSGATPALLLVAGDGQHLLEVSA